MVLGVRLGFLFDLLIVFNRLLRDGTTDHEFAHNMELPGLQILILWILAVTPCSYAEKTVLGKT